MDNNDGYFEFKEEPELPEELDYSRLENCPHCKKPIPNDATMCLYCGGQVNPFRKRTRGIKLRVRKKGNNPAANRRAFSNGVNRGGGRKHWWLIWTAAAVIIILGVLVLFR